MYQLIKIEPYYNIRGEVVNRKKTTHVSKSYMALEKLANEFNNLEENKNQIDENLNIFYFVDDDIVEIVE